MVVDSPHLSRRCGANLCGASQRTRLAAATPELRLADPQSKPQQCRRATILTSIARSVGHAAAHVKINVLAPLVLLAQPPGCV